MTRMITVASYLGGIPPANTNPEKPALLKNFIEGVQRAGDNGFLVKNNRILDVDVAVIQGWVHQNSKNHPHLNLRKNVFNHQMHRNKRCIIVDSNLFLYSDPKNTKGYLRYSYDGVFPNSGEYFWDHADPERWQSISKTLGISLKAYSQRRGEQVLLCAQRDGGWSMGGLDTYTWVLSTIREIKKHTKRHIVVRFHPGDKESKNNAKRLRKLGLPNVSSSVNKDFRQDLKNAWVVVNYNSSPAVAALIEGIPAFVLDPERSQARDIINNDLAKIDTPILHDREQWIQKIAMSHWSHSELKSGKAWEFMRRFAFK